MLTQPLGVGQAVSRAARGGERGVIWGEMGAGEGEAGLGALPRRRALQHSLTYFLRRHSRASRSGGVSAWGFLSPLTRTDVFLFNRQGWPRSPPPPLPPHSIGCPLPGLRITSSERAPAFP